MNILSNILFSDINIFFITLIAGIFGFIIAAIPFTIQLLEIKSNEKIQKINENKFMRKKLFDKYFEILFNAFYLFIFLLLLEIIKQIYQKCFLMNVFLIFIYIYLANKFLINLFKLIIILKNLINLYLKQSYNK